MIDPVVKDVWVPVSPEEAFRRFTDELDRWWPRSTHSVSQGRCAAVAFAGGAEGRLYEVDADGGEHDWGAIEVWEPPHRVAVTWHPGRTPEHAQRVEVTFAARDGGTSVRLVHSGWEILGDEALHVRGRYDGGWAPVLDLFAVSLGAEAGRA